MSSAMTKQMKVPKHLDYIRHMPCCICGKVGVEAHHLMRPWSGSRGMGMKAGDQNSVPLCPDHHRALHQAGNEEKFFTQTMGDESFGKSLAMRLWYSSPHYRETEH